MRLWSLHPKYLDSKGLVALWREALLAKAVLEGKTMGYTNHPQLKRFRESENSIACLNQYLKSVHDESVERGYNFNPEKFDPPSLDLILTVTDKQMKHELGHLLKKLQKRDKPAYIHLSSQRDISPHPLFNIIQGDIESWEKL